MIPHRDEILRPAVSTDATAVPRYNLVRSDGTIIEKNVAMRLSNPVAREGTPISKAALDEMLAASGVTAGTASAYTLAQEEYTLFDGAPVRFRLHTASIGAATLNINNTGAKPLRDAYGKDMPSGIPAGTWIEARYSAANGAYIIIGGANTEDIERALYGERYTVDNAVAYTKDVPANVLPFAEVCEIGGMTRKCTNLAQVNSVPFPAADKTVIFDGRLSGDFVLSWKHNLTGITTPSAAIIGWKYEDGTTDYGLSVSQDIWIIKFTDKTVTQIFVVNWCGATGGSVYDIMINPGTAPLPYEPYFEGLRSAEASELESVGVNLFDKSKVKNAIETDTGFCFVWTGTNASPNAIGTFKELCPKVRSGDVVYLNGISVNQSVATPNSRAFVYLAGERIDWSNQAVTVTEKILNGDVFAYGETGKLCEYNEIRITKIANAPYTPYFHDILPIPEAVRALDGYGESNPDDATEYNAIKWLSNGKCIYSHKGNVVDGAWVPLAKEEITDISDILPADNLLRVQPGGTITPVNEYSYAVPTKITYQRDVLANRASIFALEKLRLAMELLAKADLSNVSGTFGGVVKANASAVSALGTAQVRNVTISATDLTAGSSALATGDSYRVYS